MSSIWANGCTLMIVCVCQLTWHDYPSLVEGESHGGESYFKFMVVLVWIQGLYKYILPAPSHPADFESDIFLMSP